MQVHLHATRHSAVPCGWQLVSNSAQANQGHHRSCQSCSDKAIAPCLFSFRHALLLTLLSPKPCSCCSSAMTIFIPAIIYFMQGCASRPPGSQGAYDPDNFAHNEACNRSEMSTSGSSISSRSIPLLLAIPLCLHVIDLHFCLPVCLQVQ